ncbi:MAG: hypothetical protein N3C12_15500 [Candidatus Binatia bacterium]|nr:hypothetical protein [Candidatus Binatia bacterium]
MAEAMASLGLFAIVLAAVGSFLTDHIRRTTWAHQRTYAYTLAEQELEAMRAADYDQLSPKSRTETVGTTVYTIATTVSNDAAAPQTKTIAVNVTWTDPRGPQQVTVSTAYAKIRR